MYLKDYLKQFGNKKIKLFVDMDGVIADYVFGSAQDYDKKRPLVDSIDKLEEISKMANVELFIFSATRYSSGFEQKNWWLDKYAPFFKKENRIIISREDNNMRDSSILKAEFLAKYERDDSILILIDDDPKILKDVKKLNNDIILLKDTVLVDDTASKLSNNLYNKQCDEKTNNEYFIALCEAYNDVSWKSRNPLNGNNNQISNDEFVAWINTPFGVIIQHLKMEYWDELDITEINSTPQYEEYTEEDIKIRIKSLKRLR